jgi:hypothetical protein
MNRLKFKFKPHQINDSSQSNKKIDHLVSQSHVTELPYTR